MSNDRAEMSLTCTVLPLQVRGRQETRRTIWWSERQVTCTQIPVPVRTFHIHLSPLLFYNDMYTSSTLRSTHVDDDRLRAVVLFVVRFYPLSSHKQDRHSERHTDSCLSSSSRHIGFLPAGVFCLILSDSKYDCRI